jgi:hypothetical protein
VAWERLRRLLWGPVPLEEKPTCPICDQPVNGWPGMRLGWGGAGGYWAPDRDELVAHCPTHGRRPYNAPDR